MAPRYQSDRRVTRIVGLSRYGASRYSDWSGLQFDARVTKHSDVSWEVSLAAGETRTLTYEVSYYE